MLFIFKNLGLYNLSVLYSLKKYIATFVHWYRVIHSRDELPWRCVLGIWTEIAILIHKIHFQSKKKKKRNCILMAQLPRHIVSCAILCI